MENVCDKFLCANRKRFTAEQIMVASVVTIDGDKDINKILSVRTNTSTTLGCCEALNGECLVNGKLVIDLVYLNNNGEIGCNRSVSPFTTKIKDTFIDTGCRIFIKSSVIDTTIQAINSGEIKILTTISVDGYAIKNDEINYMLQSGENTYAKQEEIESEYLLTDLCSIFNENSEIVIKGGVKKVLDVQSSLAIRDVLPGYNFVTISGQLYTKVLYVDNGEIPELNNITTTTDFKQDIEINNVTQDMLLNANGRILYEDIVVNLENGENETTITINTPIEVCFKAYDKKRTLAVCDIYSSTCVLETQTQGYQNSVILPCEYFESKIEGNVTLASNDPRVDKFIAVGNTSLIESNSYYSDGEITIEGLAKATLIYLNDELNSIFSVETEIPFVTTNKLDFKGEVNVDANISLEDVDVMVKKGREVYFDAKLKVFANLSTTTTGAVLSDIKEGESLQPNDSAIEIYFAKQGDTVWDIAKELNIDSSIILQQNPEIVDPLDKDQNITLYFQKKR